MPGIGLRVRRARAFLGSFERVISLVRMLRSHAVTFSKFEQAHARCGKAALTGTAVLELFSRG
jgi:hypothetical protein